MKSKIAEFLMVDESDLKPMMAMLVLSILLSPIGYKIVFAPMGWWIR